MEKGPADKTDSWAFFDFEFNCCSSGSTKAANIGPRKAKPDDFIFILFSLAYIPCENSWIVAIIKMAIIQWKKDNSGAPGILIPGKRGTTDGGPEGWI